MKMKLLPISLAAAMLPLWGLAQSRVHYTYDNAGNRLSQYTLTDEPVGDRLSGTERNALSGSTRSRWIDGHQVSVTTYAHTGMVHVEILGLRDSDDCHLAIYTISGMTIIDNQASGAVETFYLGDHPKGIYILQVRLNGETANWKILMK